MLNLEKVIIYVVLFATLLVVNVNSVIAQTPTTRERFANYYAKEIAKVIHPTSTYVNNGVAESANGDVFLVIGMVDSNDKVMYTHCKLDFSHPMTVRVSVYKDDDAFAFVYCDLNKILFQSAVRALFSDMELSQATRELGKSFTELDCSDLLALKLKAYWIAWR
jgi:hypothetical protein